MSDYQEDHLISLELGGNPTDPRNLWPEPYPRAVADGSDREPAQRRGLRRAAHARAGAAEGVGDQAHAGISPPHGNARSPRRRRSRPPQGLGPRPRARLLRRRARLRRLARIGDQAAFISAGGYHHHIGLNTWESGSRPAAAQHDRPLPHRDPLSPTGADLGEALRRVLDAGIPLTGASDHGVSEALYLHDPDGNGVELYCDRPQEEWPRDAEGESTMFTRPLDVDALC